MAKSERSSNVGAAARRASEPITLGRRPSLLVSAGVVAHTLWTKTAGVEFTQEQSGVRLRASQ
jgi:hypothetical protein